MSISLFKTGTSNSRGYVGRNPFRKEFEDKINGACQVHYILCYGISAPFVYVQVNKVPQWYQEPCDLFKCSLMQLFNPLSNLK